MTTTGPVVGFVGTGTMGAPMAGHVLAAGFELHVHDHAPAAVAPLVAEGAVAAASAAAVGSAAEVVLLSLPGPGEVLDAVTGGSGVLAADPLPAFVIDLSTNAPDTVREVRQACADRGVELLDAPVSGGVVAARRGELTVMVGGGAAALEAVRPVIDTFASSVFHVGETGAGTVAKLVNNLLFLGAGVLVQEAYVLGAALGMEPAALHEIVSASSGGTYARLAPLLLGRRFDDVIFRMDIAAKDLALAAAAGDDAGADTPLTDAAIGVYEAALAAGDGTLAFHATLTELERRAGVELAALRRSRD